MLGKRESFSSILRSTGGLEICCAHHADIAREMKLYKRIEQHIMHDIQSLKRFDSTKI
jgi:hypothetical protein